MLWVKGAVRRNTTYLITPVTGKWNMDIRVLSTGQRRNNSKTRTCICNMCLSLTLKLICNVFMLDVMIKMVI